MAKRSCVLGFFLLLTFSFAQYPTTARFWGYANCVGLISKNFTFVVMPGVRYEFKRSDEYDTPAKKMYLYELLTGPVYIIKSNAWIFKFPLWYYYMGFPVSGQDDYFYSHNLEFLPIIEYRFGDFTMCSRTIFHNTIYASVYETSSEKRGYGLVIREMLRFSYRLSENIEILVAAEPFFGVIEDSEAAAHPIGYWQNGFRMNRLYIGSNIRLTKFLSLSPQHIFETNYDTNGHLNGVNHYIFITLSYAVKLFE